MGRMELAGALTVFSFLLYGCGTNTPEPPRTPTPLHPTLPVPELFTPTPTHLPLPTKATIYDNPNPTRTLTLLPSPTTRPSVTPNATATNVWNPPAWCERTPVVVGTVDTSAKKYVYIFGTSFSYWFMSFKQESTIMETLYSDIDIHAATFPGEDMNQLTDHLHALSREFEVAPHKRNVLLLQLGAIGLINGRNSAAVLQETITTAKEAQTCFPEASLVLVAPIPNRQQDPAIQLTFAGSMTSEAKKYGWNTVNIGPLLLNPDGSVNDAFYKDTLHLKRDIYEQLGAPAIHAAIIGAVEK